jgi:hypothetical protein
VPRRGLEESAQVESRVAPSGYKSSGSDFSEI